MSKTIQVQFNGTITVPEDYPLLIASSPSHKPRSAACADPQPDFGTYAGKFVFVEKVRKPEDTATRYADYYNGEYFVIRSTPGTIYGVKLTTGYGSHVICPISLIGSDRYQVLDSYDGRSAALDFVRAQENWLRESETKPKEWTQSVYSGAEEIVRQVKRTLGV